MAPCILALIARGDMRNLGATPEVVARALSSPAEVQLLVEGLLSNSALVRGGCANALELIARTRADLVQPFVREIVRAVRESQQKEVQWHAAQMVGHLNLSDEDQRTMVRCLKEWFDKSDSSIVRTMSLQGLADLARKDPEFEPAFEDRLKVALGNGTAAMKARARKLARNSI